MQRNANAAVAIGAMAWASAILATIPSGGCLIWDWLSPRHFPRPEVIVLALVTTLGLLSLSLLWDRPPLTRWSLDQQLLWFSVAVVWMALVGSWVAPWFFQWLSTFT